MDPPWSMVDSSSDRRHGDMDDGDDDDTDDDDTDDDGGGSGARVEHVSV